MPVLTSSHTHTAQTLAGSQCLLEIHKVYSLAAVQHFVINLLDKNPEIHNHNNEIFLILKLNYFL